MGKSKVITYKKFKIQETAVGFNVFTPEEWAYGMYARVVEWEAGSLQEAKDFIDSY